MDLSTETFDHGPLTKRAKDLVSDTHHRFKNVSKHRINSTLDDFGGIFDSVDVSTINRTFYPDIESSLIQKMPR
jgi:hypothetical protein